MDRLKVWLELNSLGKYYDVLTAHSIDMEILPDLGQSDFVELGLNLGDRKRMERALRDLRESAAAPPGVAEDAKAFQLPPRRGGAATEVAEKVQLTMIFVDLVGSTSLAGALDLEEFRDVIHRYQLFTLEVIRAHHGHVAQFIGDAVTAYFGYPTAAEDDAERAVLAGLDICSGLAEHVAVANRTMQARVGIATGDVVVEGQWMREGLAFGDTPNLAARIMAATAPGTVAISDRSRRLLGASIDCDCLGKHALKGFATPQTLWRARATADTGSRFRARQKGAMLPMVDREDELRLLESRWQAARRGQGQTVLLSGEAGIGKSRLVETLAEKIEADGGQRLNFQCSAHDQDNAFYPLVSLINISAGIRRSDPPAQQAGKLRRLLNDWFSGPDLADALGLFFNLLSIPSGDVDPQIDLAPEQMKSRLQQILIDLAARFSDQRPLLLLFEDLHWVDPSTEELIDLFIEHLGPRRVMILCTARPEYKFRWTGLARVTSLSISRLDDNFAGQIMRNALSGALASPDLEAQIIEKSGGVPLFLEEMTRMVRRRLEERETLGGSGELVSLPSTLKDLLRSQLDALVTARELVPVCAAIGRTIYPSMVQAVTGLGFERAREQLDFLAEVEILVPRGNQRDRSYAFRHALIRDAAYDLMLKSRASALHKTIAEVIVTSYPDLARQQPDMLAQHYMRAGMAREARDAWRAAAALAASRSATEETIRHLENALRQNEKIADRHARETAEIALRKTFNVALNTRAFGSRSVLENMKRLHELLFASDTGPEDSFLGLHVQFGALLMQGDALKAWQLCDDLDRIADSSGDRTMTALAAHDRGMAAFMLGRFTDAIAHFDRALERRQPCLAEDVLLYHAADTGPVDRAMRCWALALRGDAPDAVRAAIDDAVDTLKSEDHAFSRCFALNILATSYQPLGDTGNLLDLVGEAVAVSDAHNFQYWDAWSAVVAGWARARTGDATQGIADLVAGLDAYLATGSTQILQYARALLADAYLHGGDLESARATIEEMRADQREDGISYHLGVAARIEADINAATG